MRIVILDGHAMNPGDLSWERWKTLGDSFAVYDTTGPEQLLERASGAEVLLTNKTVLDAQALEALPGLRYVGVLATGYNVVDIAAAHRLGITVTNVPAYSTDSVAQLVFAFILEHAQRVSAYADATRKGAWQKSKDFTFQLCPTLELAGKTLSIYGLGRIGQKVAQIGHAFGMRVIGVCRHLEGKALPEWLELVTPERAFREADFLTLHCPLTPETRGLVSRENLALMKPTAFLVNTSRGPVVDETALAEALQAGRLAGAGVDVLAEEPPRHGSPLLEAPNCKATPHIAWATYEARKRLDAIAWQNVRSFLDGTPVNVVSQS